MELFKDNTIWVWEPQSKEGSKFSVPPNSKDMNIEIFAQSFDNYYQYECSFADIADDYFTAPTDVKFLVGVLK